MNLKDAMMKYVETMMEQAEGHNLRLDGMFECCMCPFREACHKNEDEMSCGEFIKSQLTDGDKYKA